MPSGQTIAGLLMFPLMILAYVRLARREEEELERQFGEFGKAYLAYRERTPAFLPFFRRPSSVRSGRCKKWKSGTGLL
ncbi:MAG TPA: hypothetical protein DCE07_00420 [Peptococcaceae bacterium]|nr:hypothetical protein [Peptococcaceae bacterium]